MVSVDVKQQWTWTWKTGKMDSEWTWKTGKMDSDWTWTWKTGKMDSEQKLPNWSALAGARTLMTNKIETSSATDMGDNSHLNASQLVTDWILTSRQQAQGHLRTIIIERQNHTNSETRPA